MKGTPLADVADGLHDAEFEAAARAIAEAHPQAIIRLGWEMNLSEMAWFAKGMKPTTSRRSGASWKYSGATPAASNSTGVRGGGRRRCRRT